MNRFLKTVLGVLALNFLLACPVFAHHTTDPLEAAAAAPAAGAPVERMTGEVHHLTIDDRVAGMVVELFSLQLDDGRTVVLKGAEARGLEAGARVEATGQRNGKALFVSGMRHIAPPADRALATQKAKPLAKLDGKLALLHSDYFDEQRSEFIFEVHDAAGEITALRFHVVPEALQSGMQVVVEGRASAAGDGVVPEAVTILALPQVTPKKVLEKALTTNSVLVIMMTFTDSPAVPFTQAQVQSVFAGGPGSGSVTEYFKEVSFGQQLLNSTITNWLPTNAATPAGCDYTQMGSLGRRAATAAGYNPASYQNVVYVFPQVGACGWIGLAYIGASGVWINGRNTTSAYGHELGHNFGLLHAGSLRCSAGAIGGSCSVTEYGDPFDIMGNQSAMHYNAPQKLDLGWIGAGTVVTHTTGTNTYVLNPIETAGGGLYAIKIPAFANRTYWLEYRQPLGFDGALASYPNNGAQVRVASPFETLCGGCDGYSNDTELLDMTPGTSAFTDAALIVGNSYTDAAYGISFDVLSATSTGLTVRVTAPGGTSTATTTALASSANPSIAGANVTFTATVAGTSPTGNVGFTANGSSIAGCSAIALAGSGNSRTAACSTSTLAAGANSIVGSYGGDAGNTASSSAALSQVVNAATSGLVNAGFEIPNLAGGYQYSPTGGTWVFTAGAGLTGNGNAFTGGNAPAPEGSQAAFLQSANSRAAQTTNIAAGQYTLSFQAAQRGNYQLGAQIVQVQVDGVTVGQFQPPNSSYVNYQTSPFTIATTGSHTIALVGVGTGSDFTGFVDNVRLTSATSTSSVTTLASSANPATAGASVAFTANVTGASPTGAVSFSDGGSSIASCAAVAIAGTGNSKVASCSTTNLSAGTHNIVASYGGDGTNTASSSPALSQVINVASNGLSNGGFEAPNLAGGYQYSPAGGTWVFTAGAGLTGNGNAFTAGNAPAPEGLQVAFLQSANSRAAQTTNVTAGQYTLSFQAAQRGNYQLGAQIVQVQVDGVTVGQFQPPNSSYVNYQTSPFTIATAGNHTIALVGVGAGSDFTAFVDNVRLTSTASVSGATALHTTMETAIAMRASYHKDGRQTKRVTTDGIE